MQWHSDKVIRGKTPQLPIITQVFGHTASKRRHCSAFELKNEVIKTFISLLKFSLKCGESLKLFFEQFEYSCYGSSEVTRVSEVTLDDSMNANGTKETFVKLYAIIINSTSGHIQT